MATAMQKQDARDVEPDLAEKPPFQLADIYRLRLASQAAVSPDGLRIAFGVYGFRREKNVLANSTRREHSRRVRSCMRVPC